jgi:Right handed beta helix region
MKLPIHATWMAAVLLFVSTHASAQATRTWVSGVGDDVNPCSRTAPCKTFAGAISKTAAGGEIDAMDDGGFGSVTITKSITIDGGGHLASILATSGANGVIINAVSTDVITLRRLQINGATTGANGVRVLVAKHVNIDDTQIFGFSVNGVEITSTMTAGNVQISNCSIKNNGNAGVSIAAGNAVISSCSLVGNSTAGLDAAGSSTVVLVSSSDLSMNGRGIRSADSATVRMTHNDIAFNTQYAWEITTGGRIETHVDNRTRGATVGTLTAVSYP